MPSTFTWLAIGEIGARTDDLDLVVSSSYVESFFNDLRQQAALSTGVIDVVFFIGDFTRTGDRIEFETCSRFVASAFDSLRSMGYQPAMLCVPGNHDVIRSKEMEVLASDFTRSDYDKLMRSPVLRHAFAPYESWCRRWRHPRAVRGDWPGDFVVSGRKDDQLIGTIGLNTAVNQATSQHMPASMDPRRVRALIDSSTEPWPEHRLRILLTHHPPQRIDAEHLQGLPVGSEGFHIHIFGHTDKEIEWPRLMRHAAAIQVPRLVPRDGTESGYAMGQVNLDDLTEARVWLRLYDSESQAWKSAHALQEQFSVRLPKRATTRVTPAAQVVSASEPVLIESLRLTGFRSFAEAQLAFRRQSRLPGEWTCIAGINGAGKSSVLQALCLVLLGDPLVRELGGERLNRMRRIVDGDRQRAEIEAVLRTANSNQEIRLHVVIDANGELTAESEPAGFWQQLRTRVVAAYGATRNLSSRAESGYENLSADVRRLITMFDPLSQLASAEVLLKHQAPTGPLLPMFEALVRQVFESDLQIEIEGGAVRFRVGGRDRVEALDLPDGFRAAAAWLADLCAIWCDKSPDLARSGNPADMEAIVLIDEIDLHLHPALQRKLVPKLRAALPKVQWIVTTHSPLVLANFDSNEIIALDRRRDDSVRPLDRQILGFSSDQIYAWLMETEPTGQAIEEALEQNQDKGEPGDDEIAQLLDMSPRVTEAEARERIGNLKGAIERLKP